MMNLFRNIIRDEVQCAVRTVVSMTSTVPTSKIKT